MRIRTLLVIGSIIVALTLSVAGLFFVTLKEMQSRTLLTNQISSQINTYAFELSLLTTDYLLHHTERAVEQWWKVHRELGSQLRKRAQQVGTPQYKPVDPMIEHHKLLGQLFDALVELRLDRPDTVPRRHQNILDLRSTRISERLLSQAEALAAEAVAQGKLVQQQLAESFRSYTLLLTLLVVVLGLALLSIWGLWALRLAGPLKIFSQNIQNFGSENLDYRLPPGRQDELGELAESFNTLADHLQSTIVTRNALQREVEERSRVEGVLRQNSLRLDLMMRLDREVNQLDEIQILCRGLDNAIMVSASEVGFLQLVTAGGAHLLRGLGSLLNTEGCRPIAEHEDPLGTRSICVECARLGEPMVNNRSGYERQLHVTTGGKTLLNHFITVPVMHDERVWLVMGVGNKSGVYSEDDVVQLQQIAIELQRFVENHRAQHQLMAAKESAEKANRAKSDFLAVMSHEIRTPLNVVIGMSDELLEGELSHQQRGFVKLLQKSGGLLLELINDLLDLSKIEAGQLELQKAPFDPQLLLYEVVEVFRVRANKKGVKIELGDGDGLPQRIMGDSPRIRQVVVNLLGNAIKFTENGVIRISASREGNWLRVAVRDSGIGIPQAQQARIFDKFTQAEEGMRRKHGGSGLGLTISRMLVELMGGKIGVTSQLGEGSLFHFTLPMELAEVAVPHPSEGLLTAQEPPQSTTSRPLSILVVDDSADNRTLLETFLRHSPHHVQMTTNGQEAVERVLMERFDLILMDVQMPVMDGYTATQAIREWERKNGMGHMTIVAITAHALSEDRARSLQAGCDDHMTKPIRKKRLLEMVATVQPIMAERVEGA
uniref:Sensory/regulatory protein RpfC n=1 Tax=Magnetococcus massalia (strain MO-1) TaxID=451514 RepID=A0A1S7LGQ9_MAGMO|nr:Putative histidine kinase with HAMP domain, HisKA domain, HATPase domain and response regulator receiver domain [Candidatus Magnetococcus massalia]